MTKPSSSLHVGGSRASSKPRFWISSAPAAFAGMADLLEEDAGRLDRICGPGFVASIVIDPLVARGCCATDESRVAALRRKIRRMTAFAIEH
jgi:hypothetical protein